MSFVGQVLVWPRGIGPISGCQPWSRRVIRGFACPFASSGLGAPVVWLVRRVVEGVTAFLVMTFLLCGVLSRATVHGVPTLLSKRVSFFLPTTHLAAINTMASHPQRSSRSRSPLGTLPSLAPLPAPSRPSVMSLAAILAADDPFLGSSSHAGFSGPLPPLRLPRGLDTLAATATIVETTPASSPVPTARADGFTPINHDNSFAA